MSTLSTRSPAYLRKGVLPLLALGAIISVAGTARAADDGTCHALLVSGLPGSSIYSRRYADWLTRLHRHLTTKGNVPAKNITILAGDEHFRGDIVSGRSTKESLTSTLKDFAARVRPNDQFILAIVGHGIITEEPAKLVLPGPDITAKELATALEAMASRNQVILNFSSSAGNFIPLLAAANRVNIAANSFGEGVEPAFPEFFLRGLESRRADGFADSGNEDRDGVIELLEAYNWATWQTAQWISRMRFTKAGWQVEGKESVEVFKHLCVGAGATTGAKILAGSSDASAPDQIVELQPEGGQVPMDWKTRRIMTEHPSIEDCGKKLAVSALIPPDAIALMNEVIGAKVDSRAKGFASVAGIAPGEIGARARLVVLGRPELLAE